MLKREEHKRHKLNKRYTKPYVQKLSVDKGIVIWNIVKYFLAVVNALAAIASIIGFLLSLLGDNNKSLIRYIIVGVCFIVLLSTIIITIISNKKDKMSEACKYSKGFHDALHFLRDCYGDLLDTEKEGTYYNRPIAFRKYMTEEMMKLADIISKELSEGTSYAIRVCIKTFDMSLPETNKENMTLMTLARSNVSNVNNMLSEHYHPVRVTENTDFEFIFNITEGYIEERHHYFVAHDLLKLYNDGKYKNSTKEWWKKYQTTIVMPIRSLNVPSDVNNMTSTESTTATYNILGFLCIDSKKKNIFVDKKRKFVIEYLKGLSDILYIYFKECIRYYGTFKKGGIENS